MELETLKQTFFPQLIGQSRAVELLLQAVCQRRIAPAYLLVGPHGVGRNLAALGFAELLLWADQRQKLEIPALQQRIKQGNHPDFLRVQPTYLQNGVRISAQEAAEAGLKRKAPPQIRLEQVREIAEFLSRSPLLAQRQVVVVEEAETMAEGAANGLLKTLEEPGQATLILIAPSESSLLPTLVSRCQKIPFYRLDGENLAAILRQTGHGVILQEPAILALAQGSPGEAIAAWEQLQKIPSELLESLRRQPKSLRQALTLAQKIDQTLDAEAQLWLVDYLQQQYWPEVRAGVASISWLQQLEKTRQQLLNYAQPRLVWEVTLMSMI